eukprot:173238-Chlamydomonas_euryale.AAC.1
MLCDWCVTCDWPRDVLPVEADQTTRDTCCASPCLVRGLGRRLEHEGLAFGLGTASRRCSSVDAGQGTS